MRLDKLLGARHDWLRYDSRELFVCLGCKLEVTDRELLQSVETRAMTERNAPEVSLRLGPFWSDSPVNPLPVEQLEGRLIDFGGEG